jgi:hypothetical protein
VRRKVLFFKIPEYNGIFLKNSFSEGRGLFRVALGRKGGREKGGREEGRKGGREEGRREEGRKGGREEGRKGRKGKRVYPFSILHPPFSFPPHNQLSKQKASPFSSLSKIYVVSLTRRFLIHLNEACRKTFFCRSVIS